VSTIDKAVFRAYDIRGIVGEQLDEASFYRIGLAVAYRLNQLNRQDIVLARDGRLSSDALAKALQQGLLDSGINVLNLGATATPVMYYATHETGIDSGLMVTGSHNPADYNGIKLVLAGKTLAHEDITQLYDFVQSQCQIHGQGRVSYLDIMPQYCQRVLQDVHLQRPLRVVVDCGNGIAGPVIPEVIRQLGCEVIELFCEVDGRFPNHHPDPTVEENLLDLKAAVKAHNADLGLAFDGDADRLGVVTNALETIWPDRLMMLYARDVLKRHPQGTIVFDVKCSAHLSRVIEEAGGVARMCPTGHSIVKGIMKQTGAILAGEMSGHLFFKDQWYGFDDALYSACRLLEIFSQSTDSVSEQCAAVPNSINTPEIKIPIFDDEKFKFMQQLTEKALFPDADVIGIDGLRVEFAHGWGLIRASNTTPCLVARFEADDWDKLTEIQALFKLQLHAIDSQLAIPF
jgi:phosphomannomutase